MPDGSDWSEDRPRLQPRPHQEAALKDVLAELEHADRATLVMACGTGKTLVGALAAAEYVKNGGIVIALFPSLALIAQTLPDWQRNWPDKRGFRFMVVCSDPTVSKGDDVIQPDQSELVFDVSTDPADLTAFLITSPPRCTSVVFVTYHSAAIVGLVLREIGKTADFGLFDEAHRTAGSRKSSFSVALKDELLQIRKRLFMTATPRVVSRLKRNAAGEFQTSSMDDRNIYGNICHRYTFRQAVEDEIICPYKILVSHVSRSEVLGELDEDAASQVALERAMKKTGAQKIISYHRDIAAAESFANAARARLPDLKVIHVNGNQSADERRGLIACFKEAQLALATNAKCLTEGIDVPAVDMVAFLTRKESVIDIVQATGRALRKNGCKEFGYIVIPLLLDQEAGESVADAVKRNNLNTLWTVISSLADEDSDLSQDIKIRARMAWTNTRRTTINSAIYTNIQVLSDIIDFSELKQIIDVSIVDQLSEGFESWFGLLCQYTDREGHAMVPSHHQENGKNLGSWVSEIRKRNKDGKLSRERRESLEDLPGWSWGAHSDALYQGIESFRNFVAREGHGRVPDGHIEDGFNLGRWVADNRRLSRRSGGGIWSIYKREVLDKLEGWTSGLREEGFETGVRLFKAFRDREGHTRIPLDFIVDGFKLGKWVSRTRSERRLTSDQVQTLNNLPGWTWNANVAEFQKGIDFLKIFCDREGHAQVGYNHIEDDFPLGKWVAGRRYRKDKQTTEQIIALESFPGWSWDSRYMIRFNRGLEAVKAFADRTGHTRVPAGHRENKFPLGAWVLRKRSSYHIKNLPEWQQAALEAVPGWYWKE